MASYWFVILVMVTWAVVITVVNLLMAATFMTIRFAKLAFSALFAFALTQYYVIRIIPGGAFANWLLVFSISLTVFFLLGLLDLVGMAFSFATTAALSQLAIYLLQGVVIQLPLSIFLEEPTINKIVTVLMCIVAVGSISFGMAAAKRQFDRFAMCSKLPYVQAILSAPIYGLGAVGIVGMIPTFSGGEFSTRVFWIVGIVVTVLALAGNLWAAGVIHKGGRSALEDKMEFGV